jgi:hypothetical protein
MAMNAQIEQAAVVTIQPLGFVAVMSAAKLLIAVADQLMFTPSPAHVTPKLAATPFLH